MLSARKQRARQSAPRLTRTPRWAELWQIPFFLIGLICCLSSCWHYAVPSTSAQQLLAKFEASLDTLHSSDSESLRELLHHIKQSAERGELRDSDHAYLKACILLAEAVKRFPLPAATHDAHDAYQRAFLQFDPLVKSPAAPSYPRLAFRHALAQAGSEPLNPKNLDLLEQSLESDFTDREKGYQLLTELRLKLPTPDYAGALRSIDLLLSILDVKRQYPHRLTKAEILFHLERWTEITRTTAGIPVDAPEYAAGQQWQAHAAFHQKLWGEAARLWSLVSPRELSPRALLFYGQCQWHLKNTPEAQKLWERLWREHLASPEAIPAQLSLAELAMEQARWHDAVLAILSILNTKDPRTWTNTYLSLDDLKERIKQVAERLSQLSRWDDLQKLASACSRWPFAGLADYWLSQSWHAIAEPASGTLSVSPASVKAYLLAAEHAWKASQHLAGQEKADLLLQSGQDALKAQAYPQAQRALGELLSITTDPKTRSLVLLGLAEALLHQKQSVLAANRLREALAIPGNHEAQARLKLAQLLMADDKYHPEAGKQLEQAAALVTKAESGPEARTACHRWAAWLYNSVIESKSKGTLQAIQACEKALQKATPHPEEAQTRYLLAELLLAEARPHTAVLQAHADDQMLRKQAAQLWQACQCFETAIEEFKKPETTLFSLQKKEMFVRFARFGLAECWYSLGQLKSFTPTEVPSADVCWLKAAELYHGLAVASSSRLDALHAYLRLSWCQEKRGLFAEMRETLRDAYQQLQDMKDDELTLPTRFETWKRSQWEAALLRAQDPDRGQP